MLCGVLPPTLLRWAAEISLSGHLAVSGSSVTAVSIFPHFLDKFSSSLPMQLCGDAASLRVASHELSALGSLPRRRLCLMCVGTFGSGRSS